MVLVFFLSCGLGVVVDFCWGLLGVGEGVVEGGVVIWVRLVKCMVMGWGW